MSASDPNPGDPRPEASPAGAMPVTLRVLIEGAGRQSKTDTIDCLATANSTAGDTVRDGRGRAMSQWLTFSAGWYEGSPLRFEVVATAPGVELAKRAALVERADAVILVVDCSEQGWAASATRQLLSLGLGAGGREAQRGLVVFAYRPAADSDVSTAQILEELALPPDTAIVTTSPEGAGVRYGFALAVRLGLHRIRLQDNRGEPRSAPTSLDEFRRSLLDGVSDDDATEGMDAAELSVSAVGPEVGSQALDLAESREPAADKGPPEELAVELDEAEAMPADIRSAEDAPGAWEALPEVTYQPSTPEPLPLPPVYRAAGSLGRGGASPVVLSAQLEPLHDGLGRIERSGHAGVHAPGSSAATVEDIESIEGFESIEAVAARPPDREWSGAPDVAVGLTRAPSAWSGPDGEASNEELISRHLPDVFAELWPAADELQLSSLVGDAPKPPFPVPVSTEPGSVGPPTLESSPVVVGPVVGRPLTGTDPSLVGPTEPHGARPRSPTSGLIRWGGLVATLGVCALVLIVVLLAAA